MSLKRKKLLEMTAVDLMTREVMQIPEEMPLRDAAKALLRDQVGGAPVIDGEGKCVGVLSAVDFLRLAGQGEGAKPVAQMQRPVTCSFQKKHLGPDHEEVILCTLPPGVCPVQRKLPDAEGEEMLVCSQPHCVLTDWQIVQVENLPGHEVRAMMTPGPVTVRSDTPIRTLARMMIDAHIHRIIVVDDADRPIGLVSSTDLLAALSYCGDSEA